MLDHPIFTLSDQIVEAYAKHQPDMATLFGVAGAQMRWTDYSPLAAQNYLSDLHKFKEKLQAIQSSDNTWIKLAVEVTENFLNERIEEIKRGELYYELNSIESPVQHFRMVFDVIDIQTEQGQRAILQRFSSLSLAVDSYIARLERGRELGKVVAKRQVIAAIEQLTLLAGDNSSFYEVIKPLSDKLTTGQCAFSTIEANDAIKSARNAIAHLADYLQTTYLPCATIQDAIGQERYAFAAERFLGATIDPIETYFWGWQQVHQIEQAMLSIGEKIQSKTPLLEIINTLKTDPQRGVATPEELVEFVAQRQQFALQALDQTHFDIPAPIKRIDVKLAPPGGPIGAYYLQPNEDFSRPGTVYYSPGKDRPLPLWDEVTTAYHEGFPGHHLQVGLQVYLADRLTRLHRLLVCYSGYAEGWALYAESLMNELGFFEKPEYVLGMLAAKLFRAARVVLDIGLHLQLTIPEDESFHPGEKWTYELAVEFLTKRVFAPEDQANSEVTRYLGWPGQAISYKVGERVFTELRQHLQETEKERFSLREFHSKVLHTGSVGLDLLRRRMLEQPLSRTRILKPCPSNQ